MSTRKPKEYDAVVLVLDVGRTSTSSGFLNSVVQCASEQIQRKVFSESADRFGIVVCGTQATRNPMDYPNITLLNLDNDVMTVANFELLEYVEKKVKALASDAEADWLDAVVVALDHLKSSTEGTSVRSRRIILFSDLGNTSCEDHLEKISKAMIREGVEFVFIGPDWVSQDENGAPNYEGGANANPGRNRKPKTHAQILSEAMIDYLVSKTNGLKLDVDVAMAAFLNKERKKKKPFPWKVDLEIGNSVKIPVVGYIHVRREAPKSWKKCLAKARSADSDEVWELKPETSFVKNDEDLTVIEPDQLIESYKYGSELIAVSDVDKASLFNGGPKSLVVVGFVQQSEIPIHLAMGDGTMVFQPIEGNKSSMAALSALVNAMHSLEMVCLVRKVYSARSSPRLAILVPSIKLDPETKEESTFLTYIEMPFMDDIRYLNFAPLFNSKVKPSDDQLNAVDNLIDAMLVDDPTVLQTDTILNPYYQHLYKCLTHRALYPNRIMPSASDFVKKIMDQPENIRKAAEKPLEKIKTLFKLDVVDYKKEKTTGDKFFGSAGKRASDSQDISNADKKLRLDDLSLSAAENVTHVGTTTPAEDFNKLLQQGFDLRTVNVQLEKVILNFLRLAFGGDFSQKILDCLSAYRTACLDLRRPGPYNEFLRELKPEILSTSHLSQTFWLKLIDQGLSLIDQDLERNSDVTNEEARDFAKVETDANADDSKAVTEQGANLSDDDMLDDL